ncbi:MAG: amidohydrolase family protein [Acidobacteria bacterium]|nr:amidohydrolase family protein [Acidobacteriota bacterium]
MGGAPPPRVPARQRRREARRAVREALLAGADVIKVVVDDRKRVLDAAEVKAIVDEAHRVNVRIAAHATSDQAIQVAIQGGVDSVEHGDEATDATFQAMARYGVFLVATHWTAQTLRDIYLPSYRGTPQEAEAAAVRGYLEKSRASLQRALKSGVRIVAGSDMWMRYPGKTRGERT